MKTPFYLFISIAMLANTSTYAQVGVDNTDPDPSAVLDLNSTDKGLLIPRMTSSQRQAIVSPANSLLVFDTDLNTYFYYQNGQWRSFNRWSATPSGSGIYYNSGNIGIGTASPNAPLQFANVGGKKIVLRELANNDHQFNGFGMTVNGHTFYQSPGTTEDHIWYAGASPTNSNELMRLTGTGLLSISDKVIINNTNALIGFGESTTFIGRAGSPGFHFSNATAGDLAVRANGAKKVLIGAGSGLAPLTVGDSYVGIGTTSPNAPLAFANSVAKKKIALFDPAANDHQFYGLGVISPNYLSYQVESTNAAHVWYAGTSSTTSNELMRLTGAGYLGIGTIPNAPLQFDNVAGRKIVLREVANNDHQFNGFGMTPSGHTFYQLPGLTEDHIWYAGTSATTSNRLMKLKGTGELYFALDDFYIDAASTATIFGQWNGSSYNTYTFSNTARFGIGVSPSYLVDAQSLTESAKMRLWSTASSAEIELRNNVSGSWSMYIPLGSTEFRLYGGGADRFTFTTAGIGTGTDWLATSDQRLKKNFRPVGSQLQFIKKISSLVTNYDRKDNGKNETGFIAQQLAEVAPEYVNVPNDPDEMQSVNYAKMVVPLFKGTAELAKEVERLRESEREALAEIQALRRKIEDRGTVEMGILILLIVCVLAFAKLSHQRQPNV